MKKVILLTLSVISMSALAQDPKRVTIDGVQNERITCQHITIHEETNTATLVKNVKIATDRLYLEADSVIYDMTDKSIVAYQYKDLKFKGELVLKEQPKNIIRYKFKSDKLYID
jgi:lipopolysaccharide export system protein LptA